jgi:hypothetical protein
MFSRGRQGGRTGAAANNEDAKAKVGWARFEEKVRGRIWNFWR